MHPFYCRPQMPRDSVFPLSQRMQGVSKVVDNVKLGAMLVCACVSLMFCALLSLKQKMFMLQATILLHTVEVIIVCFNASCTINSARSIEGQKSLTMQSLHYGGFINANLRNTVMMQYFYKDLIVKYFIEPIILTRPEFASELDGLSKQPAHTIGAMN